MKTMLDLAIELNVGGALSCAIRLGWCHVVSGNKGELYVGQALPCFMKQIWSPECYLCE